MNIQDELAGVYRLRDEAVGELQACLCGLDAGNVRDLPPLTEWGSALAWYVMLELAIGSARRRRSGAAAVVACQTVIGALLDVLNTLIQAHVPVDPAELRETFRGIVEDVAREQSLENLLRESVEAAARKKGAA